MNQHAPMATILSGPIPIALAAAEVAIAASRACGNDLITYVEATDIVSQAAHRHQLDPAAIWVLATRLLHLESLYGHVEAYRRHAALSILALENI